MAEQDWAEKMAEDILCRANPAGESTIFALITVALRETRAMALEEAAAYIEQNSITDCSERGRIMAPARFRSCDREMIANAIRALKEKKND